MRGAGTDATVSVTLVGTLGSAGPTPLDATRYDFARGGVDRFAVLAPDLGELTKVRAGES